MDTDLIRRLSIPGKTKVVLCVMDGLGGLPGPRGRTELEEADTRHLDRLAENGAIGQTIPVGIGITPGSGPGHLALFGLDPLRFEVGRGALEATGIDFELGDHDLVARGNLCTVDAEGRIVDRRAGRVATEVTTEIAEQLSKIEISGVDTIPDAFIKSSTPQDTNDLSTNSPTAISISSEYETPAPVFFESWVCTASKKIMLSLTPITASSAPHNLADFIKLFVALLN